MKNLKSWIGFFLLAIIVCHTSFSTTYNFDTVNSTPEGLSDAIKSLLQPEGFRVADENGNPWCEVWLRKVLPNQSRHGAPEAK